jgi:hypothetical protein
MKYYYLSILFSPIAVFLSTKISLANSFQPSPGNIWSGWFCIDQEVCQVGDFNGDGKDDIATFLRDTQSGSSQGDVYVSLSNGNGFDTSSVWHDWFCINEEVCDVGDFNGDGKDDIATFLRDTQSDSSRGDVYVALSSEQSLTRDPIANIFSQTVSGNLTSGDFGWQYQYDWEFLDQEMMISLDIDLIGDDPGNWVTIWEQGIEGIWSNRYNIIDGSHTYPIVFDVNFVDENADHFVTVHSENGRSNMTNWYLDRPGGWDNSYHDEIAAHEFGHMLGLYDEYKGGAVNPDISPNIFTNSIMADLGPAQARHYEDILWLLENEVSRDLSLAFSPLWAYPMDSPIPDFHEYVEVASRSIPEPNPVLALLSATVFSFSLLSKPKKAS